MRASQQNQKKAFRHQWKEPLKKAGLRCSLARLWLLETLQDADCALSAEEIFSRLPAQTCDLATLYRNLNSLVEARLVDRLDFGENRARFELVHEGDHHHHHLICRRCHRLELIEGCFLSHKAPKKSLKGFKDLSHKIEFYGLCPNCQEAH